MSNDTKDYELRREFDLLLRYLDVNKVLGTESVCSGYIKLTEEQKNELNGVRRAK